MFRPVRANLNYTLCNEGPCTKVVKYVSLLLFFRISQSFLVKIDLYHKIQSQSESFGENRFKLAVKLTKVFCAVLMILNFYVKLE